MWLSGSNFDGAHASGDQLILGCATGRTKDSIGNGVSSAGTINVEESLGKSAYHFTGEGSITSLVPVSTKYTLATVFRRNILNDKGRFFTASEGNYFFASHGNGVGQLYVEGWLSNPSKPNTQIEFFIMTNDNGVKNMWDVRDNRQLLTKSTGGSNNWGKATIGKPFQYSYEAADVFVYEALVYPYVLNGDQINHLKTFFTQKYGRASFFSHHLSYVINLLGKLVKIPFILLVLPPEFIFCLFFLIQNLDFLLHKCLTHHLVHLRRSFSKVFILNSYSIAIET